NGIATFGDLRINVPGAKRLRATAAQDAPAESNAFLITAGAPERILMFSGSPQATTILQDFPAQLHAQVLHAAGNPAARVTVTFSAPASGPSASFASPASAITNTNGVATSPILTANNQPGSFVVTASTVGVNSSAAFSLINLPQQNDTISISTGALA